MPNKPVFDGVFAIMPNKPVFDGVFAIMPNKPVFDGVFAKLPILARTFSVGAFWQLWMPSP
jgi:hypothetical protein